MLDRTSDRSSEGVDGNLVVGVGAGEERVEVTLDNTADSGYSVDEDDQGNTVATLEVPQGG